MGAADFITKPYEAPEIIRARVEHSVELAEDSIIIHETERDELTELFNKEFFYEYGKRLDEQNQIPMDAVVIDINRFHIVNELYGKDYGDLVLKRIGSSIHELVRSTGGLACRSGSNSFAVYIPHDSGLKENLSRYIDRMGEKIGDKNISVRSGSIWMTAAALIWSAVLTVQDLPVRDCAAAIRPAMPFMTLSCTARSSTRNVS